MYLVNKYTDKENKQIDEQTIVKSVTIDSLYRENYKQSESNDFIIRLPTTITNVIGMKLTAVELPNTWYVFNEYNNTFRITVKNDKAGCEETQNFTITIAPGNYDASDLETKINEYFLRNTEYTTNLLQFLTFTINNHSFKTAIRFKTFEETESSNLVSQQYLDLHSSGNNTQTGLNTEILSYLKYQVVFTTEAPLCVERPEYETCGWIMGYRKSHYPDNLSEYITINDEKTDWSNVYNGALESEGIFSANKINYIFLSVNDFVNNSKENVISAFGNRSHINKDLIGRITIKYGSFYVNVDAGDDIFRQRQYNGPVNIDKLHVKLIDKYGNLLNLNKSDYSFILEFVQTR